MDQFTTMEQVAAYTSGEKIQCLECEKWFDFLANHLRRVHCLSAADYRERYGLPAMTALAGQAYRRAHREKMQRMQTDGVIDYSHLPAAAAKAAASKKLKIGAAKTAHAELLKRLRPGDHHKIAPGGNRADGRDADHERTMQQLRRIAAPIHPSDAAPSMRHQARIEMIMKRLMVGGTTRSPKLWICRQMEITVTQLDRWLQDESLPDAETPPKYAIKYMASLVPNSGGRSNRFTQEEDAYLVDHFPGRGGAARCADVLNRQISVVRHRARALGLQLERGKNMEWIAEHIAILREHYLTDGAQYVSEKTGHPIHSCNLQANKLRLVPSRRKGAPWSDEEDNILLKYYPSEGASYVCRVVGHAIADCRSRAREFGLEPPPYKPPPMHPWTPEEDGILREHYRSGKIGGDIRKKTGHSYPDCAKRAKQLGILPKLAPARKATDTQQ